MQVGQDVKRASVSDRLVRRACNRYHGGSLARWSYSEKTPCCFQPRPDQEHRKNVVHHGDGAMLMTPITLRTAIVPVSQPTTPVQRVDMISADAGATLQSTRSEEARSQRLGDHGLSIKTASETATGAMGI